MVAQRADDEQHRIGAAADALRALGRDVHLLGRCWSRYLSALAAVLGRVGIAALVSNLVLALHSGRLPFTRDAWHRSARSWPRSTTSPIQYALAAGEIAIASELAAMPFGIRRRRCSRHCSRTL